MEKYIIDERTGLKCEFVGDYYLIAGDDDPEEFTVGIWDQRYLRHIKQHRKILYSNLLTEGKLNSHLVKIDRQKICI